MKILTIHPKKFIKRFSGIPSYPPYIKWVLFCRTYWLQFCLSGLSWEMGKSSRSGSSEGGTIVGKKISVASICKPMLSYWIILWPDHKLYILHVFLRIYSPKEMHSYFSITNLGTKEYWTYTKNKSRKQHIFHHKKIHWWSST